MKKLQDILKENNKLQDIIKRNTTNKDCKYYNWGGDMKKGYASYPSSYGARCEKYHEFFYRNNDNILTPNCCNCKVEDKYLVKENK